MAEADKAREAAKGQADAITIVAKAEANAIALKAEALRANKDVATLNAIDKWDGVMPQFIGGDSVPFINLK